MEKPTEPMGFDKEIANLDTRTDLLPEDVEAIERVMAEVERLDKKIEGKE